MDPPVRRRSFNYLALELLPARVDMLRKLTDRSQKRPCVLTTLSYAHCHPNFVEVGSPRARGSSPYVIHCHPNFIEIGSPRAVGLSPHVAEMCKSTTYDLQCDVLLPVLLLAVTMRVMFMSGSHDLVWHEILLQTLARESRRRTFPCGRVCSTNDGLGDHGAGHRSKPHNTLLEPRAYQLRMYMLSC